MTMKYKQPNDGLTKRFELRLKPSEFEVLKAIANKYCMTMSEYVRVLIRRVK